MALPSEWHVSTRHCLDTYGISSKISIAKYNILCVDLLIYSMKMNTTVRLKSLTLKKQTHFDIWMITEFNCQIDGAP